MINHEHYAQMFHQLALDKGWHDIPRNDLEILALVSSEIAEATECVRDSRNPPPIHQGRLPCKKWITPQYKWSSRLKPQGHAIELADAIIRILDWLVYKQINIKQITPLAAPPQPPVIDCDLDFHGFLIQTLAGMKPGVDYVGLGVPLLRTVMYIEAFFMMRGWPMEKALMLKHNFNKTRPYRHGKNR